MSAREPELTKSEKEALHLYEAPPPGQGFVKDVMALLPPVPRRSPGPRGYLGPVLAAAAALAMVGVGGFWWWKGPQRGVQPAVEEARVGTQPRQGRAPKAAWIKQVEGSVEYSFYRTPFVVETPVGKVYGEAHGKAYEETSFQMEIVPMERSILPKAAAAVVLVVVVSKGILLLKNRHGSVLVEAGTQAMATTQRAPQTLQDRAAGKPAKATQALAMVPKERVLPRDERDRLLRNLSDARTRRTSQSSQTSEAPVGQVGLKKEYIKEQMKEIVPLIQECYQNALQSKPALGGRILMRLVISGEPDLGGLVETAEIAEMDGSLKDGDFQDCMTESMYALRLKAPEGGGQMTIDYPFLLSSTDDNVPPKTENQKAPAQ